jgi:hypothetical protein
MELLRRLKSFISGKKEKPVTKTEREVIKDVNSIMETKEENDFKREIAMKFEERIKSIY